MPYRRRRYGSKRRSFRRRGSIRRRYRKPTRRSRRGRKMGVRALRRAATRSVFVHRLINVRTGYGAGTFGIVPQGSVTPATIVTTNSGLRLQQNSVTVTGTYYACFYVEPLLNDMNDYTQYTALFDQYRIRKAKVELKGFSYPPTGGSDGTGLLTTNPHSSLGIRVHSIIDHDSTTIPTMGTQAAIEAQIQEWQERASYHCDVLGMSWSRIFNPASVNPILKTAGSTTVAGISGPRYRQWIDCVNPDIKHYGLYAIVEMVGGNLGSVKDLIADVVLDVEFKSSI